MPLRSPPMCRASRAISGGRDHIAGHGDYVQLLAPVIVAMAILFTELREQAVLGPGQKRPLVWRLSIATTILREIWIRANAGWG